MAKYQGGADALASLETETGGEDMEFFSLRSGTSVNVRVLGLLDMIKFRSYGIYKQVNSFVADNPSVYNEKGFPKSDLTVWDKAFQYYSELAFEEKNEKVQKELRAEGRKYLGKERYALGFINLATGEPIIIDLSKKQAKSVHSVFKDVDGKGKLGKKAFKLTKSGSGTDTVVNASTLDLDDLTADELANYEKFDGETFNMELFEGILYEADEREQVELLEGAGFDVSLIGYAKGEGTTEGTEGEGNSLEVDEDSLPF